MKDRHYKKGRSSHRPKIMSDSLALAKYLEKDILLNEGAIFGLGNSIDALGRKPPSEGKVDCNQNWILSKPIWKDIKHQS